MPFFSRKKKDKSSKNSEASNMPFFRQSQSEKCRKRQEFLEVISIQDPEPRYDLSACEISQVPSHVYVECKGIQKEVLLLHDNWLTDLGPEDGISDIDRLKILDAHNNKIEHLPNDFGNLKALQILDLSHNKLKHLPDSFTELVSLQTLKLKENRFKLFPDCLCRLKCLRTLDISGNRITDLPVDLCYAKGLDTLVLDVANTTFPPPEIIQKGTGAIMMYLCGEAGIAYEHPSKYWLRVCEEGRRNSAPGSSAKLEELMKMESDFAEGALAYQKTLDEKRQAAIDSERAMMEEEEAQAESAIKAAEEHRQLMSTLAENNEVVSKDLDEYANKREKEREEAFQTVIDEERTFSNLAAQLLDYNAKAKEMEELMERAEQERQNEEDWLTVSWEEYSNVRKQEMLDAMQAMLSEIAFFEKKSEELLNENEKSRVDALEQMTDEEEIMEKMADLTTKEREEAVKELAKQEELQKAAFEVLLVSKDAAYSRIDNQIDLIKAELSDLTKQELENREERREQELNSLCDERIALSLLLSQLIDEKEMRKQDIKKRLIEMEEQKEDGQTNYWLAQYQRLMDWKPQALIDKETRLEKAVKEILEVSNATEYMATFARHRITIETLQTLTDEDLKTMGVYQIGLRRSILKNIDSMSGNVVPAKEKVKSLLREPSMSVSEPSPVHAPHDQAAAPSAPPAPLPPSLLERQASIVARGLNTECSICMERQSIIIFLPCGHVCCCGQCSQAVKECPLCRENIQARVKLS